MCECMVLVVLLEASTYLPGLDFVMSFRLSPLARIQQTECHVYVFRTSPTPEAHGAKACTTWISKCALNSTVTSDRRNSK
jgi:hypothetical protein